MALVRLAMPIPRRNNTVLRSRPSAPPRAAPTHLGGGILTGPAHINQPLGWAFMLLLLWLCFEFGRPPHTFKIPLLISSVLFLVWLTTAEKQWTPVSNGWLALLAVMALGIPLAANTFAAVMTTRDMAVLFLCVCLPLQALVNSVRKFRVWMYTFLGISLVVGVWAATHGGYGPSGAGGGQDENYVAALMGMSIALSYFSFFAEKRRIPRLMLGGSIVVFVAAIALAQNPSRGGFLGLCAVALYCLVRSPKKLAGAGVLSVAAIALVAFAGPLFWAEIKTSTDSDTGTGDFRIEVWKIGLRMWQANPLTGVGAGNFRWVLSDYQSAEQFAKYGRDLGGSVIAHSLPVELLAELGLAGVVAVAILVWATWTKLGRLRAEGPSLNSRWADADPATMRCYADALRCGMVAILVNGVFLSLMYYSHLWLLIAMGSALCFGSRSASSGQQPSQIQTARLPRRAGVMQAGGSRGRLADNGRNGGRRRR